MESTKDQETGGPAKSKVFTDGSVLTTSKSTKKETSADSSIKNLASKQGSTAATPVGTVQAASASTGSPIHSPKSEQESTATTPSGTESTAPPFESGLLLSDDPFRSEQSKLLFDAIDELRICGAGQDLDLPQVSHCDLKTTSTDLTKTQLVIVGQQSAGKSSLLQSLTDIPFPVGGGLCTRFATRIISRRTEPGTSELVQVSIEPGDIDPFGYQENESTAGNFNHAVPSMTAEVFKEIVERASCAFSYGSMSRN
jgi:hypothetical protein